MFNTSAMCRQQELHHRGIAAETSLENVRKIALSAAAAWKMQAEEAVRQENASGVDLSPEDAAIALEFLLEAEEEERAASTKPASDQISDRE